MLFANVDGQKVEARPKTTGVCPLCDQAVFSKCGEINVWHWAHHKDDSCDTWYEPETEWHKNWKFAFGKEHCEIVILKDGFKHIADVQTQDKVIIELQNSNIQKPIIRQREVFYGTRMIWVINGKPFKDMFRYYRSRSFQLDQDDEYWHLYNPLASKQETQPRKNEFNFSWSWYRRSWADVQRDVFIDFGDENLFRVEEGMGTSSGKGKLVSKETFLKEHGGDTQLLTILIDKTNKLT